MPQVGQSRPVRVAERTGPEPELRVRAVPPRSGAECPRQPQDPCQQDRRDHQETARQPARALPIPE